MTLPTTIHYVPLYTAGLFILLACLTVLYDALGWVARLEAGEEE